MSVGNCLTSANEAAATSHSHECANAVYKAIEAGYRLLDSACDHGNEQETGEGIKNALYNNLCKRDDLFIVSKLWNTFHRPEHVKLACRKTM